MLISLSRTGLVITKEMYRQLRGIKSAGTILMHPADFLLLTTSSEQERKQIRDDAQSLAQYNEYAKTGQNIHLPWLDVSIDGRLGKKRFKIGRILGHEGRHRAAASLNENVYTIVVALIARINGYPEYKKASIPGGWKDTPIKASDFPEIAYGQFNNKPVRLDLTSFKSLP